MSEKILSSTSDKTPILEDIEIHEEDSTIKVVHHAKKHHTGFKTELVAKLAVNQ